MVAKPAVEYVHRAMLTPLAGAGRVALIVMRGDGAAEHRIASALSAAGIQGITGVLTPAAFRDGMVEQLTRGDHAAMAQVGLSELHGHLVVGRLSFDPVQNTHGNLMMTHGSLSVQIVPLGGGIPVVRTFRRRGAGFSEAAARDQAEARIVEELVGTLSTF